MQIVLSVFFLLTLTANAYASMDARRMSVVNASLDEFQAKREPPSTFTAQSHEAQPILVKPRPYYDSMTDIDMFEKQKLNPRHVNTFDMGTETYYYYYREPGLMKQRGMMQGYYAEYDFRPPDENIMNFLMVNKYSIDARYAHGDLNYKGTGLMKDRKNSNYELRSLLGKEYLMQEDVLTELYVGFGYRYLIDEGSGRLSSDGHWGYDRHSTYYYLPIGVNLDFQFKPMNIKFNLEYDYFLKGKQFSDTSSGEQFNPGFQFKDIKHNQGDGRGFRSSFNFSWVKHKWSFYAEPFIRYWGIEESDVSEFIVNNASNGDTVEPKNYTLEIGSKFGLLF